MLERQYLEKSISSIKDLNESTRLTISSFSSSNKVVDFLRDNSCRRRKPSNQCFDALKSSGNIPNGSAFVRANF